MHTSSRAQAAVVSVAVVCAVCVCGEPEAHAGPGAGKATWTLLVDGPDVSDPTGRMGAVMAHDSDRGRVVLFGGSYDLFSMQDDTWEWDGEAWTLVGEGALAPPARMWAAMSYDRVRGVTLLFGGWRPFAGVFDDMWEWNGTQWTQIHPAVRPEARAASAMAFDRSSGTTVLFGGADGSFAPLGDTWEWDGTGWLLRSPITSPPARWYHGLAYDAENAEITLFGGAEGSFEPDTFGDTWAWTGDAWEARSSTGPTGRIRFGMAYDDLRQRVVLFGGERSWFESFNFADTWEWDGGTWSLIEDEGLPGWVAGPVMAYAGGGNTVLVAGHWGARIPLGTYIWAGASWTRGHCEAGSPPSVGAQMAWDPMRNVVVLFGGMDACGNMSGQTWEWDHASGWRRMTPSTSPPPRVGHNVAFDPMNKGVLLFGGTEGIGAGPVLRALSDTWLWNGVTWTELVPKNWPPARELGAMATDEATGHVFLAGGLTIPFPFVVDLWVWDGLDWSETETSSAPLSRMAHAMAYDTSAGGVILAGGWNPRGTEEQLAIYGDTWRWGGEWNLVSPDSLPGLCAPSLALDADRSVSVVFGGYSVLGTESSTYELVGSSWYEVDPASSPPPLSRAAMATAPGGRGVLLHGGFGRPTRHGDTWLYAAGGTLGALCESQADCLFGFCTDGACCEVEACTPCAVCNVSGTCGGLAPNGSSCDDGEECTIDDVCSAGECVAGPEVCDVTGCECRVTTLPRKETPAEETLVLLIACGIAFMIVRAGTRRHREARLNRRRPTLH